MNNGEPYAQELRNGILQDLLYITMEVTSLLEDEAIARDEHARRMIALAELAGTGYQKMRLALKAMAQEDIRVDELGADLQLRVQTFALRTGVRANFRLEAIEGQLSVPSMLFAGVTQAVEEVLWRAWHQEHAAQVSIVVRGDQSGFSIFVAHDGENSNENERDEEALLLKVRNAIEPSPSMIGDGGVFPSNLYDRQYQVYIPGSTADVDRE